MYALPGQSGATVMQGLDSLAARCAEYKAAGIMFAKWRSPMEINVAAGKAGLDYHTGQSDVVETRANVLITIV